MANGKKKGHVLRCSDRAWSVLAERNESTIREAVDLLIDEHHDMRMHLEKILQAKTYYVLPKSGLVFDDAAKARGAAVIAAVRKGAKTPDEEPIPVKAV
jgi:hypothetical protein